MTDDARALALEFWDRMGRNDFASVNPLLTADFELYYPQTGERFDAGGMERLNTEFPSESGSWRFEVNDVVAEPGRAVTDVSVTDGQQSARSVAFFTVTGGLISRITEFWPDPYEAPAWRAHLR